MKSSNQAKYETGNPVVGRLIERFFARLRGVIEPLEPTSVLDVGSGEGEPLARLGTGAWARVAAVDLEQRCVDALRLRHPEVEATRASALELPFESGEFDLVLTLEVLEHIDQVERAVAELGRVSARDVVVSVPWEPWFRAGSLARGKYVRSFGNHPEHVNHFRPTSLHRLLAEHAEEVEITTAFPWLIGRARVAQRTPGG